MKRFCTLVKFLAVFVGIGLLLIPLALVLGGVVVELVCAVFRKGCE